MKWYPKANYGKPIYSLRDTKLVHNQQLQDLIEAIIQNHSSPRSVKTKIEGMRSITIVIWGYMH